MGAEPAPLTPRPRATSWANTTRLLKKSNYLSYRIPIRCPVEFIRLVELMHSVGLPEGARGECADDDREPLIATSAYALTATRFPTFPLARFGFARDKGIPNLSRLPIMGGCWASTSQSSRSQSEMCVCTSGSKEVSFFMVWCRV